MSEPPLVPPLKCQGIKTKLVGEISALAGNQSFQRWVEPFCGSCVVALNVQPKNALLSDSNVHIIRLYQEVQSGVLTPALAKSFLTDEGNKLRQDGEPYYYAVRQRFNARPNSLDFLFLNRSCFNGVMRFNRSREIQCALRPQTGTIRTGLRDKNYESNQANRGSYLLLRVDVCSGRFPANTGISQAG